MRKAKGELILCGIILVFLGVNKYICTRHATDTGIDGGYYTEIARHVRDGEGVVTNLSLYHKGYLHFPHRTDIYPVWPWLYGMVARIWNIQEVGRWLPALLYLTSILAAFCFGRAWDRSNLFEKLPGLHLGHVAMLVIGLHRDFRWVTSRPYTEGLSYTVFFAFLARVVTHRNSGVRWSFELATWMTVLFFVRSQFALVPVALGLVTMLEQLLPQRATRHGTVLVALLVFAAVVGLRLLDLSTFVIHPGLVELIRFDQARSSELMAPAQRVG